ncbi:hypothetical protein F8B43_3806 [Methylorubrum populi]|uniref:Uncharacterized protein n=1 Tax=Methylorubrum populi TaxID=223967 RepID=A0A833MZM2_9HYPH|nr:hypothetical protein F8B43_3806 [Methylorubrum populi]
MVSDLPEWKRNPSADFLERSRSLTGETCGKSAMFLMYAGHAD